MTTGWDHVLMDTHHYQVFDGGQLQLSPQGHVSAACSFGQSLVGVDKWTVVGEYVWLQTRSGSICTNSPQVVCCTNGLHEMA